jgi:hypothetical protein
LIIAFVQVQAVVQHISSEKQIRQTIIINISDGYPSSIVKVTVGINIEVIIILQIVPEMNMGFVSTQFFK